ncbi:FtsK/SpoIIIE domain-containing protein [Peribacillus alkalitolerans]|uniref:FtsK/SpoIIIE domain-containing protein n=1 Tax=Peribacillus alkalitolerans TaxID=1550385 RepID=UPI0013D16977|nr:FtsK/SpoIIIE domain-containing protein [Peribacillus alkalitolerans]
MIEWLAFPTLILGVALLPKGSGNDRKTIDSIIENTRLRIPNKNGDFMYPRYKKKFPITDDGKKPNEKKTNVIGTQYQYTVPLGIPVSEICERERKGQVFSDGLGKPVIMRYHRESRKLLISVFNKDIPKLFPYSEVPVMKGWVIPLGKGVEGMEWHDFDKIPHFNIAGTTRFGKTVFLKVLMTYLIEHHPDEVEFYIIDLKGGLEFGKWEQLEQVKKVAGTTDEAYDFLEYLWVLISNDFDYFRRNFISNIVDTKIKRRRFIIVDEGAQFTAGKWMDKEEKNKLDECRAILAKIAQIAGALGYRLIYATQYPTTQTLDPQIKMNADAKLTYRLATGYASEVAIDQPGAEKLPTDIKGRALFKTHQVVELQTPLIEEKEMWELLGKYQVPVRVLEGVTFNNVVDSQETRESGNNTNDNRQTGIREQKPNSNHSFFEIREKRT